MPDSTIYDEKEKDVVSANNFLLLKNLGDGTEIRDTLHHSAQNVRIYTQNDILLNVIREIDN